MVKSTASKNRTDELPIGCFNFVEVSYRQRPVDWLAFREARYCEPGSVGRTRRDIFRFSNGAIRIQRYRPNVMCQPALYPNFSNWNTNAEHFQRLTLLESN